MKVSEQAKARLSLIDGACGYAGFVLQGGRKFNAQERELARVGWLKQVRSYVWKITPLGRRALRRWHDTRRKRRQELERGD